MKFKHAEIKGEQDLTNGYVDYVSNPDGVVVHTHYWYPKPDEEIGTHGHRFAIFASTYEDALKIESELRQKHNMPYDPDSHSYEFQLIFFDDPQGRHTAWLDTLDAFFDHDIGIGALRRITRLA